MRLTLTLLVLLLTAWPPSSLAQTAFDAEYRALSEDKFDSNNIDTGRIYLTRKDNHGTRFHYVLDVPPEYSPEKAYPLHIFLHGLVSRDKGKRRNTVDSYLERMRIENTLSLYPMGWKDAMWWQPSQVENIYALIRRTASNYHVDFNRVYLHGVSDGAHGAYYIATHAPDAFAGIIAMIGSPYVLAPANGADEPTYLTNLVNTPVLAINGSLDPLYSSDKLVSLEKALNQAGGNFSLIDVKGANHTTHWYPEYRDKIVNFINAHPRTPYPNSLYWEVDEALSFTKNAWLVVNEVDTTDKARFVSLVKTGNRVDVKAEHIRSFTLLISPAHFDITRPVRVTVNGKVHFDAKVEMSSEVLHKWYAIDEDPKRLYGAEIRISL